MIKLVTELGFEPRESVLLTETKPETARVGHTS